MTQLLCLPEAVVPEEDHLFLGLARHSETGENYGVFAIDAPAADHLHQVEPGLYRHYKGKLYLVLGVAFLLDRLEVVVVYVPKYETPEAGMSVRPLYDPDCGFTGLLADGTKRFAFERSA